MTQMNYSVQKTIDALGRIVLPKNMRDYYGINLNDKLNLIPTDNGILITKAESAKQEKKEET